jgi:hypothetical protein
VIEGARLGGFSCCFFFYVAFFTNDLGRVRPERIPESIVKGQGDDGLWKLIEISSKYVCGIVDRIAGPVKTFSILGWRVENGL